MQETIRSDIPNGKFDPRLPAGMVAVFAGSVAPGGWLICNGAAVSRAGNQALFMAIGTTYGVGDGSTTFNLPDLRGKTAFGSGVDSTHTSGANQGATWSTGLGTYGGEVKHTLSTGEIPSHSHSISPPAATYQSTPGGFTVQAGAGLSLASETFPTSTGSAGSGGGHNTMGPFLNLNYIIKT